MLSCQSWSDGLFLSKWRVLGQNKLQCVTCDSQECRLVTLRLSVLEATDGPKRAFYLFDSAMHFASAL